jgi:hypothetical protein
VTSERRLGRVTIVERPDALIVTSPFLSRRRSVALLVAMTLAFVALAVVAPRGNPIGLAIVLVVCGYYGLILALNRAVATVQHDRIVVRRGPVPLWPATIIDAAHIVDVHATVVTGMTGRGGRMILDTIAATMTGGRTVILIDDAGDASDAEQVAGEIAEWLASHAE